MRLYRPCALLTLVIFLSACSTSLQDYQSTSPEFNLQRFFNGNVTAWGIVQDYSDKVSRRFCVDIVGTWQGNSGQLHETFYYADGEQQIRIWQLLVLADGTVTGSAGDVIGQASGSSQGMSFNWQYTLDVPVDGSNYQFKVDDWMYMLDEERMMNRSYMSKLGVRVAEISIFFDKSEPFKHCSK